jgi:perosamine synthetase
MYSILVDSPNERESLRDFLKASGIETRPTFFPVHTMPMFSQKFQKLPVAEYLGWHGINMPSWPGLTKDQIEFIAENISKYYSEKN